MSHLTPEELVDAADGMLPPGRHAHLASCEACRRDVELLAGLLREAAEVPVPEPSPLFWTHFSARVREAVALESAPARGWSAWLRWPALVPLAGLALVLLALVGTLAQTGVRPDTPAANVPDTWTAADVPLGRDNWELVAEALGPLDWDTAGAAGLAVTPGDVDAVLLDLDEDVQRELSRLLLRELARSKS